MTTETLTRRTEFGDDLGEQLKVAGLGFGAGLLLAAVIVAVGWFGAVSPWIQNLQAERDDYRQSYIGAQRAYSEAADKLDAFNAAGATNGESEYYRGIFDVCVSQTGDGEKCNLVIVEMKNRQWFEQPSEGFAAP